MELLNHILTFCSNFFPQAIAEFAQVKVELAKALEAQTGSQSEQMNLAQRTSELVTIKENMYMTYYHF